MSHRIQTTFAPGAFDLLLKNTDDKGIVTRDLRVSLSCVRGVWVVDVEGRATRDHLTIPAGYDMDAITSLVERFVRETHGDDHGTGWRMPPLSTAYLCDDGRMRTIGQMLEGISIELMPHDELDFHTLLFAFGVDWTHPLVATMRTHGLLT